jgi:hypothetical protein
MPGVAVEGELRDREHRATDIGERALHAALVVEDPEAGDLRREALAVLRPIRGPHAEQDDDSSVDFGDALALDVHGGGTDALHHRAR